jgi:hypothetical protein
MIETGLGDGTIGRIVAGALGRRSGGGAVAQRAQSKV